MFEYERERGIFKSKSREKEQISINESVCVREREKIHTGGHMKIA